MVFCFALYSHLAKTAKQLMQWTCYEIAKPICLEKFCDFTRKMKNIEGLNNIYLILHNILYMWCFQYTPENQKIQNFPKYDLDVIYCMSMQHWHVALTKLPFEAEQQRCRAYRMPHCHLHKIVLLLQLVYAYQKTPCKVHYIGAYNFCGTNHD